jgi:hypothetical protein
VSRLLPGYGAKWPVAVYASGRTSEYIYCAIFHQSSLPKGSAEEFVYHAPSCPHQVLGLNLASSDLAIFGALLNVLHQFLLLIL